ncbi:hypothetical protein UP17_25345 (plasmid) [Peribacillus simplex]|uniref:hypothetical protein n=1 Tax=Peribacillus simplex TaxID=1478 RepID=UPI0007773B34|nr:hypothetical protein [Peribacillus simplex]AMM95766.1 hypothetical protein UP17_25345 [Peribacillus simplex]
MGYKIIKNKTIKIGKDLPPIDSNDIINAVKETNEYILTLTNLFKNVEFDLFEALGQRNLSGLIGEIFSVFLAKKSRYLLNNPHPDGRPDIIFLRDEEEIEYFNDKCFIEDAGIKFPLKSAFAPFKYGGIEVKCTIGDPVKNYRTKIAEVDPSKSEFEIYMPRIDYLKDLNWWAHHTYSSNLLGIYYDYYSDFGNLPQIMAVFNSELSSSDWNALSTGKEGGKKTSNTSLNKNGKLKMKNNCVCIIDNEKYKNKLKKIKINI